MKSPYLHLVIWVLICVAAIAGYWTWYNSVATESVEAANLQTQTVNAADLVADRTTLAELSGDQTTVEGYFVPETGMVSFVTYLQGLAQAESANMKVLSVSTSGTIEQSNFEFVLSINITGTFDSVMRTIGAVEYAPYDLTVSNLSMTQSARNEWQANLELNVGSVSASTHTTNPYEPLPPTSPKIL
jgi:hypothetical protein